MSVANQSVFTSKMTSSSTGVPRAGRLATPYTRQQGFFNTFRRHLVATPKLAVRDFQLVADISRSGNRHAEPDHARHFVERSQILPRNGEDVERREVRRLAARFDIELRADASDEFRRAAFRGKHPGEKKQVTCLHRFGIDAERLRRRRELDAQFSETSLGGRCVCGHDDSSYK